jgi:hypothetical protein
MLHKTRLSTLMLKGGEKKLNGSVLQSPSLQSPAIEKFMCRLSIMFLLFVNSS